MFNELFNNALKSEDPIESLSVILQNLIAEGHTRNYLYNELKNFRKVLQKENREEDEDIILEIMDFLTGFGNADQLI